MVFDRVHGLMFMVLFFKTVFCLPLFFPRRMWGWVGNLRICQSLSLFAWRCFGVVWCWGWFVFGWVWAFHGLLLIEVFCGEFDPGSG